MIDAHGHLTDPRLMCDLDGVFSRMEQAGVGQALVVGCDLASSRAALELAQRFPKRLRAAVGVHPHDATQLNDEVLHVLRTLATDPLVVAIGEIGLDYYYDHSPRLLQREAFCRQLALARELSLPIIIHERDSADELMTLLDEMDGWACGGNWHCCSVEPERAQEIARAFYLGIAGWITFPKADNIRALVAAVPIERLLVETDAPYITPVPHRGKTNEPSFVRYTIQALATLKGMPVADVEEITERNTTRAFPRWGIRASEE